MTKACIKCGLEKEVSTDNFYHHPQMADGFLNKCKECTRVDVKANRAQHSDHYKQYDRDRANLPDRIDARKAYQETPAFKESHERAVKKYNSRNPEKKIARDAVKNALRDGRLQKQPCEKCGGEAEAHHDDYSKPLEVRWMCDQCHKGYHKEQRKAA